MTMLIALLLAATTCAADPTLTDAARGLTLSWLPTSDAAPRLGALRVHGDERWSFPSSQPVTVRAYDARGIRLPFQATVAGSWQTELPIPVTLYRNRIVELPIAGYEEPIGDGMFIGDLPGFIAGLDQTRFDHLTMSITASFLGRAEELSWRIDRTAVDALHRKPTP
jgi:hypothetical protein